MIFTLSCPDKPGLVSTIAAFIASNGGNVLEMSQFTDPIAKWFFVRVDFELANPVLTKEILAEAFRSVGDSLKGQWEFRDLNEAIPTAILVSKEGHCLQDLLARTESGELPIDVRIVLGNHDNLRHIAERYGVPFQMVPIRKSSKEEDFQEYRDAIEASGARLVLLARFMQILPKDFCEDYFGRAINIHHSFLPAFVGANPYKQAFERGVKIIGATAHYVTQALDAGPIIEQEVQRVEHYHTPENLRRIGRDCECLALSRAVRYHANHRVLIQGNKTIVFRD